MNSTLERDWDKYWWEAIKKIYNLKEADKRSHQHVYNLGIEHGLELGEST